MKIYIGILLFILFFALTLKGQKQNESVFNIPISLTQTQIPLAELLNEISKKADVYFSYDASSVVSERLVSLTVKNKPIIEILNYLFNNELFSFIEKENQIIITLIENKNQAINKTIENHNLITISGNLKDEKKGTLLQFASISVQNKPIGTITNAEGEYVLKIHRSSLMDTIIFSCLGYAQKLISVNNLIQNKSISLKPVSIKIKEVKVTAITPHELLNNVIEYLPVNYGNELLMMKAFYRETLKQDNEYINISEAVIEVLKSQYSNTSRQDKVRVLKGRKSPDVRPFQWVNFKLMGGPSTITKLDVLKTMDSFIDPEFRKFYKYHIDRVIWFHGHPVYVLKFKPVRNMTFPCYQGEIFIDRETFAVLHINFGFSKHGLRIAAKSLIRKKPRGFSVRPEYVKYDITYRYNNKLCYLNSISASIKFKVRNHKENINSQFDSVLELLVTDFEKSQIKRFPNSQIFSASEIFTENLNSFDEQFWGNFNTLKPDEDLQTAIKNLKKSNKNTLLLYNKNILTNSENK